MTFRSSGPFASMDPLVPPTRSANFKALIVDIVSELRSPFEPSRNFAICGPCLDNIVSQQYRKCGRIAQHEALPHPVGTLFRINRDYEIHPFADVGGQIMLENTTDDANHTVSLTYGGQSAGEKLSLSTSHMLDESNHLKLQYSSDLRKDAYCSLYACHNFDDESLLHARYWEGIANDPVVEVELQHHHTVFQAVGKLQKNLGTGHQEFSLQSKNILPAEITVKNLVHTDLRNDMSLGIELESTSTIRTASSRILLGLGRRELYMKGGRSFRKNVLVEASVFTDFDTHRNVSVETKCKVLGQNEISFKFSSGSNGIQANVKASLSSETNSWMWRYRSQTGDGHMLGVEWKKEGPFNNLFSLSMELSGRGVSLNGQLNHYFEI